MKKSKCNKNKRCHVLSIYCVLGTYLVYSKTISDQSNNPVEEGITRFLETSVLKSVGSNGFLLLSVHETILDINQKTLSGRVLSA